MRRTGMSSIPGGIQRFGGMSTVTSNGVAHPEPPSRRSVAMPRISILKRAINTARAGLVFVGMLSPAHAAYQHDTVNVFPDLPKTAVAHRSSAVLTAHLPWLAPIGHRPPPQA